MENPRLAFIIFATAFSLASIAQQKGEEVIFKDGDRVCFIGNSITNNGQFHNFIALYYATRFPNEKIQFFNCGISGDAAGNVIRRMDKDILVNKPTWSLVKLGMNDVGRGLYSPFADTIHGIQQKRQAAIDTYKENLEIIINTLLKNNSKVVLQKPSIYDQAGALKAENHFGVNDALKECCKCIDELAAKYNLPTVDYWTILNKVNQVVQQKDSTATIIGPDRVHPGVPGHFIMAYQFLKSTLKPGPVTNIKANAFNAKNNCNNCEIKDYKSERTHVTFSCKEESMLFPIKEEAVPALTYIPFTDEFNTHILQVSKLKKGNYDLVIDNMTAGRFTSKQLQKGINLVLLQQTPQYKQSGKLLSLFNQYLDIQREARIIRFVEFDFLKDSATGDVNAEKKYLYKLLDSQYVQSQYRDYYRSQFDHYLESKPREQELYKTMDNISDQIHAIKPTFHQFEIIKSNW